MNSLSGITRIDRYFYLTVTIAFLLISHLSGSALDWYPQYFQTIYIWLPLIVVISVVSMASIIYYVSFTVKRLHDIDYNGFWSLLLIVPFINIALILFLLIRKGEEGTNKYGQQSRVEIVTPDLSEEQ